MTARAIPDKRFFRIGEASRIVGVPPHVLRYWEREFPLIRPRRTPSRQRLYRRSDVEMLLRVKDLLYQEKYTIAGARKRLRPRQRPLFASPAPENALRKIREELLALRRLLD